MNAFENLSAVQGFTVRLATMADAQLLLEWRNDPLTRAMSRTTEPVAFKNHVAWLNARLSRSEPHLYIAEAASIPVGTLRVDGEEVSYTIAPEHRGKGYATKMLRWAFDQFGCLKAEIKAENAASIRAAERAGHTIKLL